MKDIEIRTCIICRSRKHKSEFIRIVKNSDGKVFLDLEKSQGRGAYICKNLDCFQKLKKNHVIEKTFRCKIDLEIYEQIRKNFFA